MTDGLFTLEAPPCDHEWKHEIIVDAERCIHCGDMRLTDARPISPVVRSIYDERTLQRIDAALAAAARGR